jgi:hypothetical protein
MTRYWIILVSALWIFVTIYLIFTGRSLRPVLPFVSVATLICVFGLVISTLSRPNS